MNRNFYTVKSQKNSKKHHRNSYCNLLGFSYICRYIFKHISRYTHTHTHTHTSTQIIKKYIANIKKKNIYINVIYTF